MINKSPDTYVLFRHVIVVENRPQLGHECSRASVVHLCDRCEGNFTFSHSLVN